jgi:universal stress protein E
MSQYQRLLLIIDPTLRQYPAQHAMALARASGASLHILALVPAIKGLWMLEERDRLQLREDCLRPHRDWLNEQTAPLHVCAAPVSHTCGPSVSIGIIARLIRTAFIVFR